MTNRRITLIVCAAAGLAFATGLVAAPAVQPEMDPAVEAAWIKATTTGEHHRHLEALIGNWEGTVKIWMAPDAEPMEFTGTIHREWALDGRYVFEHVTTPMPDGGTFKGMGIIGYNTVEGVYESVWLENQSTYMSMMTGKMDPEKHAMSFTGKVLDPTTGKRNAQYDTIDLSNPNRHVSEAYTVRPDGVKFKSFEGVMEKVD